MLSLVFPGCKMESGSCNLKYISGGKGKREKERKEGGRGGKDEKGAREKLRLRVCLVTSSTLMEAIIEQKPSFFHSLT